MLVRSYMFMRVGVLILASILFQHAPRAERVSVMTFNVENLFDTVDDPKKDDKAYLPLKDKQTKLHKGKCSGIKNYKWRKECFNLDWSDAVKTEKQKRIADVIKAYSPDIVFLQEVENISVLKELVSKFLKNEGYQSVELIDGRDERGIDVAVISRFKKYKETKLVDINFRKKSKTVGDTRGLLVSYLLTPKGQKIAAVSVHMPAPYHPWWEREDGLKTLNNLYKSKAKDELMLAGGDFNIIFSEYKKKKVYKKLLKQNWFLSHRVGCKSCMGSYFYFPGRSWSFLDFMLLGHRSGWHIDKNSVQIANKLEIQKTSKYTPARFDFKGSGVSDHWPVYMEINSK